MKECVVEVGPATVRGPCDVDADVGVDGAGSASTMRSRSSKMQPVAVAAPLAQALPLGVTRTALDTAVLVCPTWWPPHR